MPLARLWSPASVPLAHGCSCASVLPPWNSKSRAGSCLPNRGAWLTERFLDVCEVPAEDGRTLTMLLYGYRVGGVDYQCSQDVTEMHNIVDVTAIRAGFPCSVRYQSGNPQNTIVISERWSGLRASLPALAAWDHHRKSFDRRSIG